MKSLDPRAKLFWALAWMFSLFLIDRSLGQVAGLLLTLVLIRVNGLRLGPVIHTVRYLVLFLPITFLVHLLVISQGWQLFTGAMSPSLALLEQPLLFSLRVANLILLMAFVLKWIRDIEFLDGIYALLRPLERLGWRIDDFFQIIFIAVKFFPLLQEEYQRLDEGWKLLGEAPDKQMAERIRRVRKSLIPLMIFSFQRAETLADAITVRGYSATVRRSLYQPLKLRWWDWCSGGLALGFLASIILWA